MTVIFIYQLLDKVDAGKITPTAGSELSFLDTRHQAMLNEYIEREDCGVSIKQAKQIRESFMKGKLNENALKDFFIQEEKQERVYLDYKRLQSYFPKGYTIKQCEEALWKIIEELLK